MYQRKQKLNTCGNRQWSLPCPINAQIEIAWAEVRNYTVRKGHEDVIKWNNSGVYTNKSAQEAIIGAIGKVS